MERVGGAVDAKESAMQRSIAWVAAVAVLAGAGCSGGGGERASPADGQLPPADRATPSATLREVVTPEGIRLRFPPGFVPFAGGGKEGAGYAAVHEQELIVASIGEPVIRCEDAAREDAAVQRFDTAGGFGACALPSLVDAGEAFAIVLVELGGRSLTVTAKAAPGRAEQLARAFAEDVREGRGQQIPGETHAFPDPRLVGCWDIEWEGNTPNYTVIGAKREVRCFAADGTFTSEEVQMYTMDAGLVDHRASAAGAWGVLRGELLLAFEDGGERAERLEWRGSAVVLDGRRWDDAD
jgi:hypothetical protein